MGLSEELISQFVQITNDTKRTKSETTVYGNIVEYEGTKYVRIDGSELLTPISTTTNVADGERVTVMIKNHTATVTGNVSSPSARVVDIEDQADAITELETAIAKKVDTEDLVAEQARIDALVAENVTIKQTLAASEAVIGELTADNATINNKLTANSADIATLKATSLDASVAALKYATIESLEATDTKVYNLTATYAEFTEATADNFEAIEARIEDLTAGSITADDIAATYATIAQLDVERGRITALEGEVADIDTLIFGSATGNVIQASFANAVIAQVGNAQIKSAMVDSLSASKLDAGDIDTNKVRMVSEDGKLLIADETIQISDDTRVRVQIGKDASGDYSINVWDAAGNLMFSEGGITDSAIKDAIIRNDMVSDTANIAAHKLDIDSLFEEINGSEKTINSSKIHLDAEAQTLDLAFDSLKTDVEDLSDDVSSQGTAISVIQGQIASKVWQSDIDSAKGSLSTQYSELEQEVDSMSATVANHTATIAQKADSSTVSEVNDRVTSIEANLSGFQSTVSSTYATKNEVAEIEVGARNLLLNTGNDELPVMGNGGRVIYSTAATSASSSSGVLTLGYSTTAAEVYYRFMVPVDSTNNLYGLEPGKSYTFSGKAQVTTTSGTLTMFNTRVQTCVGTNGWEDVYNNPITRTDTSDWVGFSATFTVPENATGCYVSVQLYFTDSWVGTIKLKHLQLEKGTVATDWAPAPEDYPTVELVNTAQATAEAAQASVDNLEVGGRNLLLNSKVFRGSNIMGSAAIASETYKDFSIRSYDATALESTYTDMITFTNLYADKLGSTYTLSFYAKGSTDAKLCTYFHGGTNYVRIAKIVQSSGATGTAADGACYWTLTEDWQRYWVTWTLRDDGDISIIRHVLFRLWSGGIAEICGCKLEKGEKATDWTPAPEDVDVKIATAQAAAEAAQAAANQNAQDMANIVTAFNSDIANLQTQIDGSITTWFYPGIPSNSNEPAVNWTSDELKNVHLGDLYYDTDTDYCYRYRLVNGVYSWEQVKDTDVTKALSDAKTAQDTADQKRRVFYAQPTVPYDAGDLWVQGSGGDILRCQTAKVSGQTYSASDWVAASKYTDDTVAKSAAQQAASAQQAANAAQEDIDNLTIGGRNLLFNSRGDNVDGWVYGNLTIVEDDVKGHCVERTNVTLANENYIGSTRTAVIEPSTEYTFSADMWVNDYFKTFEIFWLSDTEETQKTGTGFVNVLSRGLRTITPNTWTRVTWTFTTRADDRTGYIRFDNNGTTEEGTPSVLRVANLKLEKGNRATDWTPAPEDLGDRVTVAETKLLQNENSISSLANRTTVVENKFAGYSTTEQMNSAITQSAKSIETSVKETYTTKTEFEALEVGGRNLVVGTSETIEYVGNKSDGDGTYRDVWSAKTIDIPTGTEYIVSFDAKADVAQTIRCHFYSPNTTTKAVSSTGQTTTSSDGNCDVTITTEWARYWVKWTQTPADTRKSIIVGRNFTENDIYIRKVKFEAGNTPTDWTPAPEDMATMDELASVQSSADLVETRVSTSESLIQQLSACIASLVTDANGESLMTQTSNGWTFSTAQIQGMVNDTATNLDALTNEVGDVSSIVSILRQSVDDLGVLSEYINIGTYEGEPCIELGESDSDFKLLITNTRIMFKEGSGVPAYFNNQSMHIKKAVIEEELQQGEFVWKARSNGNLGLIWKGATS